MEKGATLVITEQSNGSLKAVGGAYGAAGIGGKADAVSYFHGALETKNFDGTKYGTGRIIIKGGTIAAEGGAYWVSGRDGLSRRSRNRNRYAMESAEPLKYWVER